MSAKPLSVFVTDGNERPALAIVRALGQSGANITVGSAEPTSLASSSRFCSRHVVYPSPARDRESFERFLTTFLARELPDVVLPVSDVTTHAVASRQDLYRRFSALAVPPCEAFELVSNKRQLLVRAARCGIRIPHTLFVDGLAELKAVLPRIEYPVVVKPIRSRIRTVDGWMSTVVHHANSDEDLDWLFRNTEYLARHPSLIQERIGGAGVGMFGLFDRGELVVEFAHRRLREKPPSGGVSVLRESIAVDPVVRENVKRLFGPLKWHGVAMVEFKEDSRTGELVLMEVNGRFWGSLQLAIDAGVNFPLLACELARRQPVQTSPYKVGVKSRWLLGDLDHLLLRLFKSDRELRLPPDAPSRLGTCREFMKFRARDLRYEIIRRDDLRPFLYEVTGTVRQLSSSAGSAIRLRLQRIRSGNTIPATESCPIQR
ncbi:MAG: ATP-grasp domain-containing protein [Vicinamibacterales bacterium]